jgi:hypothetical protein
VVRNLKKLRISNVWKILCLSLLIILMLPRCNSTRTIYLDLSEKVYVPQSSVVSIDTIKVGKTSPVKMKVVKYREYSR